MDYRTLMSTSTFTGMVTSITTKVLQFLCSIVIWQSTCFYLSSSFWMPCSHSGNPNWLAWDQMVQIVMMGHHNGVVTQIFTKGILWWRLYSSFWWVVNTFPISIVWVWVFANNKIWSFRCNSHAQTTQHVGFQWVHWHLDFCKNISIWTNFFVRRSKHQVKPINWFGIITFAINNIIIEVNASFIKLQPKDLIVSQ